MATTTPATRHLPPGTHGNKLLNPSSIGSRRVLRRFRRFIRLLPCKLKNLNSLLKGNTFVNLIYLNIRHLSWIWVIYFYCIPIFIFILAPKCSKKNRPPRWLYFAGLICCDVRMWTWSLGLWVSDQTLRLAHTLTVVENLAQPPTSPTAQKRLWQPGTVEFFILPRKQGKGNCLANIRLSWPKDSGRPEKCFSMLHSCRFECLRVFNGQRGV